MNDALTLAEIDARSPDEWILIDEPKTDRNCNVLSGKVLFHSKDRDEVYQEAANLRLKDCAFHYTGAFPPDMALVL